MCVFSPPETYLAFSQATVHDWTGRRPLETEGVPASPRSRGTPPGKGSPLRPHSTRITEGLGRARSPLQEESRRRTKRDIL
jgi:hypothetical protein